MKVVHNDMYTREQFLNLHVILGYVPFYVFFLILYIFVYCVFCGESR